MLPSMCKSIVHASLQLIMMKFLLVTVSFACLFKAI